MCATFFKDVARLWHDCGTKQVQVSGSTISCNRSTITVVLRCSTVRFFVVYVT